jgi:uncharacterized protein
MILKFNLRHLEEQKLRLQGELPVAALDIDPLDPLLRLVEPLRYDLEVEQLDQSVLVRGRLSLTLNCECVRCLRPFAHEVSLPDWACHLAFSGEEATPVVNDCVDLTPYIRDDIVLAFPQHPLCKPECKGLPGLRKVLESGGKSPASLTDSAWAKLNTLKLEE